MSKIQGGDLMLFVDGVSIGYATNHTLEIEADTSSFDCKDEGEQGWSNEETIQLNWTVTSENIYAYDPEGKSYENLNDIMISRQPIDVVFYLKAESGSQVPIGGWHSAQDPFRGQAIITDLDMNAPHGDYASFTATFTGWGELVYEELVDYLCTETVYGGTFSFSKTFEEDENDIEYSLDKENWTTLASEEETPHFDAKTKVYWRGHFIKTYDPENQYRNGVGTLRSEQAFNVGGNPMSLIRPDIFYTMTDISEYKGAFAMLFNGNENSLKDASKLHLKALTLSDNCYEGMFGDCYDLEYGPQLPATKLAKRCYSSMFQFCNNLKEAPSLPATIMKEKCYSSMFQSCIELLKAPALPSTELAEACYQYMFENCSKLKKAPDLPATIMKDACYYSMFQGCENLETIPWLPALELAPSCYGAMFRDCSSLWDLTQCAELPATTLVDSCYEFMFYGCSSLVFTPDLPATELANNCYNSMFRECYKIRRGPTLPAQSRVPASAYQYMFYDCNHLESLKCMALSVQNGDSWSTTLSFPYWMHGVNDTGEFISFIGTTWQRGEHGIPTNWTSIQTNSF